jgi:hypothetical protein
MNSITAAGRRAGTIALQIARADEQAWGQALEATARTIAVVAALAFVAGEALGRWVHQTSAALGQMHACLLAGRQKAAAAAEPVAVQVAEAIDLAGLTVVELRRLARRRLGSSARLAGRRIAQCRRADLLLALA